MDAKTLELVARIVDVEFIGADTEAEALILESSLIKQHKPRYNVMLKYDTAHSHLKLHDQRGFPAHSQNAQSRVQMSFDNTLLLINQKYRLHAYAYCIF